MRCAKAAATSFLERIWAGVLEGNPSVRRQMPGDGVLAGRIGLAAL